MTQNKNANRFLRITHYASRTTLNPQLATHFFGANAPPTYNSQLSTRNSQPATHFGACPRRFSTTVAHKGRRYQFELTTRNPFRG